MDRKTIIGGIVGAIVTLLFALGILYFMESVIKLMLSSISNVVISLLTILLAPMAGGFLAGLISPVKPLKAGLITGLTAGIFILIAWVVIMGFSYGTLLSGCMIVFVWVVLARLASGFAQSKKAS